jgi:UDP-N-acetylglucosamine--N-acetylmuramyl-(pentapeptide) pyrophosphoryl-undecaprenol N-acetylglucosamine transferase
MRILIAGGGTGGHTSPAVAIIEELQRRDPRLMVQWVGRRGNIEERVCRNLSIPFRSVPIEGWPRRKRLRKAWAAAKFAYSIARCLAYVKRFKPQVAIGVGGYASLPALYAAQRLGVPTVLHEQNKRLGMANAILAPKATRVLLSYPETSGEYPREKARVVGNPVRAGFMAPPGAREARERFGLAPDVPVVLVFGGSQGAHSLNEALKDALGRFNPDEAQFIWAAGNNDIAEARRVAEQAAVRTACFAFIDDMPGACAAADIVVGRSGASSTAELAVLGKPSILVPYPHATDNHQEANARAFESAGAAVVLLDHECTGERLAAEVRALLHDRDRLAAMGRAAASLAKPGAAETIADEVLALVFPEARP